MFEFLEFLTRGDMSPGEKELAFNLTVIYGMSILCMVVLYRLLNTPQTPPRADVGTQPVKGREESISLPSPEETLHLIKSRRSVMPKDFSGESVTRAEVEQFLEAANWAPTHGRTEPWRYVVIQGGAAVSAYLDRVEEWYSEHGEELPEQEYQQYTKKMAGCRNSWPGQVSHLILIAMARQSLPDKRMPEVRTKLTTTYACFAAFHKSDL